MRWTAARSPKPTIPKPTREIVRAAPKTADAWRQLARQLGGPATSWRADRSHPPAGRTALRPLPDPLQSNMLRYAPAREGSNAFPSLRVPARTWSVGRNVRIDYRWSEGETERYRAYAADLVALSPDIIIALGSSTV